MKIPSNHHQIHSVTRNKIQIVRQFTTSTVGSRFKMIHSYDPCRVGPSTPDLWCITVAIQASFLYLMRFRSFPVCMCFLFFYFSAFLLSWLLFFHPWRPSKRLKRRKNQNSCYILSWCLLNHRWAFFNKIKSDLIDIFFNKIKNDLTDIFLIICVIFYIPNSLN